MKLDDPLDQSEAHSRAFAARIQLVEEAEDALVVLRVDAEAVVADEENDLVALPS